MLDKVKLALRIKTDAYNAEILDLIAAGEADLQHAGVTLAGTDDPLFRRAVITYCRMHFGSPTDYDRLKAAYDQQKAQLMICTGYTDFGGDGP